MATLKIDISIGEALDRKTILEIKSENIKDPAKLENVRKELNWLSESIGEFVFKNGIVVENWIYEQLKEVNSELWSVEDDLRLCEKNGDFGQLFIDLARSVYVLNDRRAEIKKKINLACGSDLIEEKSYEQY